MMVAGGLLLLLLDVGTVTAVASALSLVTGIGLGLLMQSTLLITMNSADARDMGAASGTATLVRTIGGTLGVALLGAIYTGRLEERLTDRLGSEAAHQLFSGGELTPADLPGLSTPVHDAVQAAVTNGLHGILIGTAVLSAVAFAAAWLIREVPLRTEIPAPADTTQDAAGRALAPAGIAD
jgi:hypothetical protein